MLPGFLNPLIGQFLGLVGQMHARDEIMRWVDKLIAQFLNQEARIAQLEKDVATLKKSIGLMVSTRERLGRL